jgi:trehalose-phosphatase
VNASEVGTFPADVTASADWVGRTAAAHRAGRPVALLFDYDGTLTPIVAHPSDALLPEATRRTLLRLIAADRVTMGVLSGRMLADLRSLIDLPGLWLAGTAGLEFRRPDGRVEEPPGADDARRRAADLADRLEPLAAACPGAWVERKPLGVTVHHRGCLPQDAAGLVEWSRRELERDPGAMRAVSGPRSLEITAALGWTKATAVGKIVAASGPDTWPVYAGDAENDADALAEAGRLGGLGLGVGPDAPATALVRLPGTDRLAEDLADLADRLGGR